MRRRLALPLLLCGLLGTQCFPVLPDPGVIDSLRVLAVRADPAVAMLDTYPLPTLTVTALVVDPADESLGGVSHTWTLDLPDDVEGIEQLQAMVPDPPHGVTVEIDLNAMLSGAAIGPSAVAAEDGQEYLIAALPLRYRAETADDHREAVKLVSFLMPDFSGGDDDDATGDDDDSAAARAIDPEDPPAGYNENPALASLTINGGVFTAVDGLIPGPSTPMVVGPITPTEGLRLDLEVTDDKDPEDVSADLFWTTGCPGLPLDLSKIPPNEHPKEGECPENDSFGFGSSATIREDGGGGFGGDDGPARSFGWHPATTGQTARLFLVLMDAEGGQTWQEIRVE
ncbi:MAG: hypothetical protein QGH45_22610 [Myxococcota bacterium]|jgi:hypothetical protein|nr:hypothetical protein [Myxococcota bacterium]